MINNFKILGIHAFSHDAGACLISNNNICAISEERLTRIKYDGGFPKEAIKYVMKYFNLKKLSEIDLVLFDKLGTNEYKKKTIQELRKIGYKKEILCINHHDAHAASAFFTSPFTESAILVIDGFGTSVSEDMENFHYLFLLNEILNPIRETQTIYIGRKNEIKLLRKTFTTPQFQFGIGLFYAFVSKFLGFGDLGAGKLMALAAYGGKKKILNKNFLKMLNGEVFGAGDKNKDPVDFANLQYYGEKIFNYSIPLKENRPIKKIYAEIAYFAQKELEKAVLYLVNDFYDTTKLKNLCYSGGVALNCLTNTKIIEEGDFKNVFIQPAATDTGIPLGCALYGYHIIKKMPRKFIMKDVFLGKKYTEDEILSRLKKVKNISYSKPTNLTNKIAQHISEGKIIGWFEGRSELGPRALGHRSILADPRSPKIKKTLDEKVKHREWFRPYAPAVLEEFANEYFEINWESPFMLYAAKVRKGKKHLIPAVIHVDGTVRVQTINKKILPRFHQLIKEFYNLTNIPLLLNTSFNVAGEPMVETSKDALSCFLKTNIDYLVLENFLVEKR